MTIDERSALGQQLGVGQPIALDLQQLSEAAGAMVAGRMERHESSAEESVIGLLNFAAKIMTAEVVHLDTERIYARHPEVREAVTKTMKDAEDKGTPTSPGKVLTQLIVRGASPFNKQQERPKDQRPPKTNFPLVDELLESIFRKGR